jgi:hypothetical protein
VFDFDWRGSENRDFWASFSASQKRHIYQWNVYSRSPFSDMGIELVYLSEPAYQWRERLDSRLPPL